EPEWLPRFRRRDPRLDGLDALGAVLALYWAGCLEEAREFEDRMAGLARRANEAGYLWVDRQARALIDRLNNREPEGKNPPLVDSLKPAEAWRRSLDALLGVALQSGGSSGERVAWRVEEIDGQFSVRPYLQKRSKKGDWTGGRDILPARLLNQHGDVLLEQDRNALRTLVQGLDSYRVGDESTLAELVGHPYVYWEPDPSMRLEIQRGTPEIRVLEHEKEVQVDVQPVLPYFSADVGVLQEGPHRLRVYRLTENQKEIARILGKGLRVPVEAADELRQIVESLAPYIGVQSDLSGSFAGVKEVEAEAKPNLFLIPHGVGLRLEMRVLPVGENGPAFPPSQGGRMVLAELKKIGRVQTSRDLEKEFELGVEILEACPTITRFGPGGWNWVVDSPTDCLEVLEELQELPPGKLALHWPEGETMSVRKPAGLLKMEVKKSRDWFAVNGELEVDEDLVLDINSLLDRLQHSHGRFLQLEDGQFLALTDRFRQRLEQLADLRSGNGKEVLLNPLAAAVALGEDVEGDKAWKDHLRQFKEAWNYRPEVPSTLRARLRGYQRDGFGWLAQLAHLQTGACLADD
ncbi:MAG: hypothetical protein KC910_32660, partial [Candidatus Eremiobacteraeota bacterium]|nr:hypothetical protein [Candidatus Eremiobacteraeota bacterium]